MTQIASSPQELETICFYTITRLADGFDNETDLV